MNHRAIARAALKRHDNLLRATRDLVDAGLPQLTPVDAGLLNPQFGKTNPPRPTSPTTGQSETPDRIAANSNATSRAAANPVDTCLPQLTPVDTGLPIRPFGKTNPPSLSPRQLAAARLLALGRTPADVAGELRITRQGLWKWRRHPAFIAELSRLHELFAKTNPISGRR